MQSDFEKSAHRRILQGNTVAIALLVLRWKTELLTLEEFNAEYADFLENAKHELRKSPFERAVSSLQSNPALNGPTDAKLRETCLRQITDSDSIGTAFLTSTHDGGNRK